MRRMLHLWLVVLCFAPAMATARIVPEKIDVVGVRGLIATDTYVPAFHMTLLLRGAGSVADPKGKEGLAQIAAAMLLEGAGDLNDDAFHRALESYAIGLSAQASTDHLSLSLATLREHRDKAFELLTLALTQPQLKPERLEEVKARALARIKRRDESPSAIATDSFDALAFGDHPYGRPALGTAASVESITIEDVRAFVAAHFSRNRVVVAIAGDLKQDEAEDALRRIAAPLAEHTELPGVAAVEVPVAGKMRDIEMDVPQVVIQFGRQGLKRSDPDFYAAYVMNHIVGGMSLTSRLGMEVREKRGLTYGIGTALNTAEYADVWGGSVATRPDQHKQALKVVEDTLRSAAQEGFTPEELTQAIGYITGSFPLALDNNASIASYLMLIQLEDLGLDYLDKRNDYFRSVTLEQVNAQAKKLLDPDHMIVVRAGGLSLAQPKKETR